MPKRYVILGAGPAGLAALETLRALDPKAEITLVCDEPPYARMVIPYYLIGNLEQKAVHTGDEEWFRNLSVETRFGARATGVDAAAKRVTLDDGSSLEYDALLVATGSRVAKPDVEGAEGEGVIPMWTLDHANAFLGRRHRDTIIVGAGFIAFTILDAIVEKARRVRFVEMADRILPRMLDVPASAVMEARLAERGIEIHKNARLERIEDAGDGRRLLLATGEALECDAVILATGVRANVEFLEGSGVEIASGISVDAQLQTSVPGIYAAGDCAAGLDLLGAEPRVQAIQPTAVDHGRVAAANMAGHDVRYAGSLTMNILAAQGLEACSFGRWDEDTDTTVVDAPAGRIHRKYVWQDDVLVGAVLVGPSLTVSGLNDAGMLKGLIQTGVALGPWKAYLHENPLELRRAYVASGAAMSLLGTTLLAGRATAGGGFRFPKLPARRPRSSHHAVLVAGAPTST